MCFSWFANTAGTLGEEVLARYIERGRKKIRNTGKVFSISVFSSPFFVKSLSQLLVCLYKQEMTESELWVIRIWCAEFVI